MKLCNSWSVLSLLLAFSSAGWLLAQEEDEPVFAVDGPTAAAAVGGTPGGAAGPRSLGAVRGANRADSLGGTFLIQRMSINQNGMNVLFWGARIVSLDRNSPLKTLGVRNGDVITRLDGLRLDNGLFKNKDGDWIAPELDRHFGETEVRYIISGTNKVLIGEVSLIDANTSSGVVAP